MDLIKKAIFDYMSILFVLRRSKYSGYLAFTALITVILGTIAFYVAYKTGAFIADNLTEIYPFEFGKKAADTFFHLVPFTYIFAITGVKYIIFILSSPFLHKLSKMVEHELNPESHKFRETLIHSNYFIPVIKITGRAFYKEILWTILFGFVGIIVPVAGMVGFFIVQAYYIGSCYMQLVLLRKLPMEGLQGWVKKNRGLSLGNGAVYLTVFLIPLFGFLIASALAVSASTKSVLDVRQQNQQI